MDFITQDEAKVKIKEWLIAGETEDIIKQKLAGHGFIDMVINNLLSDVKSTVPKSNNLSKLLLTSSNNIIITPINNNANISVPQANTLQKEKPKNIFDFKNMQWYEWLAMLPAFFLLIKGGAIGALVGILGWSLSLKVIRNESHSKIVKILFVVGITIGYWVIYLISAVLFLAAIHDLFGK